MTENVDESSWERLIDESRVHDIFQSVDWANVMRKEFGCIPKFVILHENEKLVGGLLMFKKNIFGVFPVYESHGGPLILPEYRGYLSRMFDYISNIDNQLYILLRPSALNGCRRLLLNKNLIPIKIYTILIDLSLTEDVLWKELKKQARWSIRKAQKIGVMTQEATSKWEWDYFYNVYSEHCRQHGIARKTKAFLDYLFEILVPRNRAKLFLARYKGNIVGGSLFLIYESKMYYYINASNPYARDTCANDAIMWYAIKWGKMHGVKTLDLSDLGPEKEPYYGINFFKKKWGGELVSRDIYVNRRLYSIVASMILKSRLMRRVYELLHQISII